MTTELTPAPHPAEGTRLHVVAREGGRGRRLTESAWRRVTESVPPNSRSARAYRLRTFAGWCAREQFQPDEPGAVPSFLAHLADRGHPENTLRAMLGTLRGMLAVTGAPLDGEDVKAAEQVIRSRAQEAARNPHLEPGPLRADGVTPDDLRAMVRTLDRSTPRGARDALLLLLDWWMAGRCSEPAALFLSDVTVSAVTLTGEDPGATTQELLQVQLRLSKTDQAAHGKTIRIFAPDDAELCPIAALRDWRAVLAAQGQLTQGPLLRRIDRHGNIGVAAAGRRTHEAHRRGGISDRTVRTIISEAAQRARLVPAVTPAERAARRSAKAAALAAAEQAASEEEADAIIAAWRTRERVERRLDPETGELTRVITGHSMRRGFIQHHLQLGHPAHKVAEHSRHAPGGRAFQVYVVATRPDLKNNVTRRG